MKTQTQTQTKHTPGPWVAEDRMSAHGKQISGINIATDDEIICRLPDGASVGGGAAWPEQPANAALIAAAPELLEALKWASERVAGRGSFEDYMKCQRAIAKAEGMEAQAENLPTG